MKKIVCILLFCLGIQSAHADAEAIRRNNCWGFLSYRYKASGYIYSMNPFTGKKDVEEFRDTDRNCNPGAHISAWRNAILFNSVYSTNHWGYVTATSNAQQLSDFANVSSPQIVDAGRANYTFPLHSKARNVKTFNLKPSEKTAYSNGAKAGVTYFKDNLFIIEDLEMEMTIGSGANGINITQMLVYVERQGKELDETSQKIYELRLEYKNNSISEYGNFENRVSFDTKEDGILRVNYHVAQLKIEIPKSIDHSQISIRLFSDIRNSQSEDRVENELLSNIYPNPSNGNFKIELEPESEIEGVQVFNSYNHQVGSFNFSNRDSKQFLNLGHLPSGIYYLHIKSSGIIRKRRIIIE